jgi:UDP-N-acetylmuramoyl-tripeptide--D-alanyl-D-alanine ligase
MRFGTPELAAALGATHHGPASTIDGASFDSRSTRPGELFVPIVAERDGHDYIAAAIERGATATLSSRGPIDGVTTIAVDDTGDALLRLGAFARHRLPGAIVGVTGSVGKTTTKDLLAGALAAAMPTVASAKSFNNEIGLPVTLLGAPEGTQAAVLEMGMRGFGQIARLCEISRPTIGVITVIGWAHTEMVGGLAGVARAKGELLEALPASGTAIVNADQPEWQQALSGQTSARVLTFGTGSGDVRATDVVLDDEARPQFTLRTPWGDSPVKLAVSGAHLASNAAAAAAAALAAGASIDHVVCGLERSQVSAGRSTLLRTRTGAFLIDDSYNANPTSMRAGLATLCALPVQGRRVAALGLMAELGPEEVELHRALAADVSALGIELLGVGTERYGVPSMSIDEAAVVLGTLGPGDAVLVKASRAAGLDVLVAKVAARE